MLLIAFSLLTAGNILLSHSSASLAFADEAPPASAPPAAAPAAPAPPPPPPLIVRRGAISLPAGGKVAIIPIKGNIYDFTFESLKRRVDRAVAAGVDVIVFEIDTNGGVLTSALEISKFIRAQIERPDRTRVPTIAWINDKAYSAGILIASAAGHIIMSPAAATGDCAPISALGNNLAPTERAKALSPLLTEFRSNAEDNSYPYAIYHAMCVLGVKLYLVEHKSEIDPVTGGPLRTIVNQIDYQIMVDGKTRSSLKDEVAKVFGSADDEFTNVGLAKRDVATDADRGQWKLIEEVHDGTTLLTVGTKQAVKYGLALPGNFSKDVDIEKFLAASAVYRVDETWSETMAGWLVSMPVRAVLIVIFIIGVVAEMMAPGISVFGIVAACALILLIISPMLVGLAEVWHLLLFLAGFILLMVEIFVTPGFGFLGIGGIVAMLAGIVLAVVPTAGGGPVPLPAPEMMATLQQSALWTLAGLIVGSIGLFFLVKYYGQLPLFNRMILNTSQQAVVALNSGGAKVSGSSRGREQREGSENDAEEDPGDHPAIVAARKAIAGDETAGMTIRIGDQGRSTSELRPMGKAEFAGRVIDVQSEGGWIEAGRTVRVVKMIGSRVIVDVG